MGFLQDIFSGGASNLVETIGNTLDKVTTTKEEKLQLELEMKKAELEYQVEMKKLSVEEKQLQYKDVDSARQMASVVQTSSNATKLSKNVSPILALATTLLTFALFYLVMFKKEELAKNDTKDVVLYILGVLSAVLTQIFSFYFGSSQGSSEKNHIINQLKKN